MRKHLILSAAAIATLAPAAAFAVTSVNLQFNAPGSTSTLAATGFDNAYLLDPSGFEVTGGNLVLRTMPGDTFGNYENDPDTAKNFFFSEIEPLNKTVLETKVTVTDLNVNFHGGGLWMGTDQDHYIRFGIIHNSFEGGLSLEGHRENEDLWPDPDNLTPFPGGPGGDIVNVQRSFNPQPADTTSPVTAWLKIERTGHDAQLFYKFAEADPYTLYVSNGGRDSFDFISTDNSNLGVPGQPGAVEGAFKVGVYAMGGPDGQIPATFKFDFLTATSTGATRIPGDADNDGDVDNADILIWAQNFTGSGVGGKTEDQGDFNQDASVDNADALIWAQNFTGSLGNTALAAVPEPGAAGVLAVMTVAAAARRRRSRR